MAELSLEERVAVLEAKVEQLQRNEAVTTTQDDRPWWEKIVGVYENNPDFDEAMRLGREWRESFRPEDYGDAA